MLVPAVLIETMMFSMEAAVKAQLKKASRYLVQVVLSKRPAGKVARLVQLYQAARNPVLMELESEARPVTALKLSDGNDVSPVQPNQV